MPFEKGQSGNPGGRKKDKPWADALRLVVNRDDDEGKKRLVKIAEQCVKAAEAGDLQAMREIGDRLDGKPAQAIIGGDDDDPVIKSVTKIELVGVRPSDSNT